MQSQRKAIGVRVLLVEDLAVVRKLIADMLSRMGGVQLVATASREAEATSWIEQHPHDWDLAIVDLVLDAGSGMGVIGHGRRHHPAGKIVVFSSFATPHVRSHCIGLGADAVFDKMQCGDFVAWLDSNRGIAAP
jgi:two-component system OmpR family response regulator